jgi:3-dehydroquinate synthase
MTEIEVKIPAVEASSYKIDVGIGILNSVWDKLDSKFAARSRFVVTDRNVVGAGHLLTLLGKEDVPVYIIDPPGEVSKNIETLVAIIETMEKAALGRDTVIIAIGGGTVGDISGFAGAVFKRGVPVVQIPTTTVSQADSAVGGKTGVDSSISKNAFGAFWPPAWVAIDVSTLNTLSEREYRAGLVESVKHALIADEQYFDFIEKNMEAILSRDLDVLGKLAVFNCTIKASVVEADPTEKNQRRMLNYGHTIGHAVESASGFSLLHGEAVAIGIIAAGMIEIGMGIGSSDRLKRTERILEKLSVPLRIPEGIKKDELIELIRRDKKAVGKWPKFVLIERVGHVHCENGQWAVDVSREIVDRVLDNMVDSR